MEAHTTSSKKGTKSPDQIKPLEMSLQGIQRDGGHVKRVRDINSKIQNVGNYRTNCAVSSTRNWEG